MVNCGELVFALLARVVAKEVPERWMVDAAKIPAIVVVEPLSDWLAVLF